jgi:hypothetical protein
MAVKLVPAKVGADKKRIAILGGLVVVLVIVFFANRDSSPVPSPGSSSRGPLSGTPSGARTTPQTTTRSPMVPQRAGGRGQERRVEDFRPTLKLKEEIDITRIDPALKLDLLARLKNAPSEPGSRGSVFDFGVAPPPKVEAVKPGPMVAGKGPGAAAPEPPKPAGPPPTPPPPPIPLKYYGYSNAQRNGPRRAFFLDGDDIQVAGENEMIRNRFKVIKILVNSVIVEDTTNKNQQTLPLIEELAS